MSDLTLAQKVSLAENVLIQDLAGESVLLDLESEEYFGLDEIGTRMLTVANESESLQVAYEILLAEYEVDEIRLKQDLLEFVAQLVEYGLVRVSGS
ncbi:MAG: PqqD family protein [Cyanobacteria bacterium SBLK]|nr:PqqD family protein [Cyanobacteria bacterium SBLK]